MSHYTVLVIGDNPELQLAPYHEFECTGRSDQYVKEIDITEEVRGDYETRKTDALKDSNGNLHSFFDDKGEWVKEFSQPDTHEFGLDRRKEYVPPGYKKVKVGYKELQSFVHFASEWNGKGIVKNGELPDLNDKHKYGWVQLNENGEVAQVIRRTNPNSKWDWYQLGGRWTGFFKLKPDQVGKVGEASLVYPKEVEEGCADQALKQHIDFVYMRADAAEKAGEEFDEWISVVGQYEQAIGWSKFDKEDDKKLEHNRKLYNSQPAVKAWEEHLRAKKSFSWGCAVDKFGYDRSEFVNRARNSAVSTYAVVYNGVWSEKGKMGWFGLSMNEMDQDTWNAKFNELLDKLPDDTLLSVYDCHI